MKLISNTRPAERLRGCVWAENFRSREDVALNGGEVFGTPVFEKGGVNLNGTTDYVKYELAGHEFNSDEISIVCEFVPDFATNDDNIRYLFNTSSGKRYLVVKRENGFATPNGLVILLGETVIGTITEATYSPYWYVGARNVLVISGTSGDTSVWLNGNLILSNSAIAWTPDDPTELYVGSDYTIASFFDGVVRGIKIFRSLMTAQEASDYYTQKTFRYMEDAILNLSMTAENNDPTNVRTLDRSGNAHHAIFGDGVTPTTYPDKLDKRGYYGNGTAKYFNLGNSSALNPSNITIAALMYLDSYLGNWIIARDDNTLGRAYSFGLTSKKLSLQINGGAKFTSADDVPLNQWLTVFLTGDPSTGYIGYINGREFASGTWSAMNVTTGSTNIMRRTYTGSNGYLLCELGDMMMWNKALTLTQLLDLHLRLMKQVNHV